MDVPVTIPSHDGRAEQITLTCGIFTLDEVEYFAMAAFLHYVLRNLAKAG